MLTQANFTTPTDEQYHRIWEDESPQTPVTPIHEYETIWLKTVPDIGLVLGGADMGGSFDEQIVTPPTTTPEEVHAFLKAQDDELKNLRPTS